jgi:hypothetical protein
MGKGGRPCWRMRNNGKIRSTSPDSHGLHCMGISILESGGMIVWRTLFTIYVFIEVHGVCGERKEKKGNTRSVEIGRLVRLVTKGSPMQSQPCCPRRKVVCSVTVWPSACGIPVSLVVAPSPHRTTTVKVGTGQVEFFQVVAWGVASS